MAETMTKEQETAKQTKEAAKHGMEKMQQGEPTQAMMEAQERLPTAAFAIAAGASVVASAILFARKQRDWGLFVGEWAPTFLITGLFYKMLRPSRNP
jgi:hypothetical protein